MTFEQIAKPDQWIVSQTFTVRVEEIPKIIGPTFMKLGGLLQEEEIRILSTPFVSYKNMEDEGKLDENAIEMEVGFPIAEKVEVPSEVDCYYLPSYQALSALYVGRYEDMTGIYLEMLQEIKNIGGKFLGISYEYYLSDEEIPPEKQETILELVYESK
ncbi:GyrI-like domain-containing protein [Enterococcus sp. AZ072]|uniref:GyrI-like domain-containing protein n=1 Tax=unclassified Enterococcus TaxID=2608891 RepID=UPI003D2D5FAE